MVLTFFFAQFLGALMILLSVFVLRQRRELAELLADYRERRTSVLPMSLISLILGLMIVLTHNVWDGGFLPVLITVLGWVTFLKGAAFLVLTPSAFDRILRPLGTRRTRTTCAYVMLIVGIYLFLAGSGGR